MFIHGHILYSLTQGINYLHIQVFCFKIILECGIVLTSVATTNTLEKSFKEVSTCSGVVLIQVHDKWKNKDFSLIKIVKHT